jgi:hypothetical protein
MEKLPYILKKLPSSILSIDYNIKTMLSRKHRLQLLLKALEHRLLLLSAYHIHLPHNWVLPVFVFVNELPYLPLTSFLLKRSQHQSSLWGHPQILGVSEVLGEVREDIVGKLSTEEDY